MLRTTKCMTENLNKLCKGSIRFHSSSEKDGTSKESVRLKEFRKKLQEQPPLGGMIKKEREVEEISPNKLRAKAISATVEEYEEGNHPYQEKEPLKPFPDNINPETGEKDGPKGPEPTRYGDWERKGRVTDF